MIANIQLYLILIALTFSLRAFPQQSSTVYLDSSNKNKITVTQAGNDVKQKSEIGLRKSDSNLVIVNQHDSFSHKGVARKGITNWIENTGSLVKLFLSIAALIGMIYAGVKVLKKRQKRIKKK